MKIGHVLKEPELDENELIFVFIPENYNKTQTGYKAVKLHIATQGRITWKIPLMKANFWSHTKWKAYLHMANIFWCVWLESRMGNVPLGNFLSSCNCSIWDLPQLINAASYRLTNISKQNVIYYWYRDDITPPNNPNDIKEIR